MLVPIQKTRRYLQASQWRGTTRAPSSVLKLEHTREGLGFTPAAGRAGWAHPQRGAG